MTRLAERVRRAEREAENRPYVVLELARNGAVDRPVTRVVDARRKLVREQLPIDLEQLDGQHTDVAELIEELRRDLLGCALQSVSRRSARDCEDPAAVLVLGEGIEDRLAVTSAHSDDRQLAIERDELLRELVVPEDRHRLDDALPFPVVAEAARLHERRKAALSERAVAGGGNAEAAKELLLDEAILPPLERACVRNRLNTACRLHRNVLELVGHRVGALRETVEEALVVVRPDKELADVSSARVGSRVEEPKAHVERRPGEREHAPELSAPDATERVLHADGSGAASTDSV